MFETPAPRYAWGEAVSAREDLFNDGSFPQQPELEAPLLGEHNRRILATYLGYTDDQIAQLESAGVLHSAQY